MTTYESRIRQLSSISLAAIKDVCREFLPAVYKYTPNKLPYGDKNFAKIFTNEDQLNGYAVAYTDMHSRKLELVLNQLPYDALKGDIAVVDWACGQGLATLYLQEYINRRNLSCRITEVILIEPSVVALERARLNIALAIPHASIHCRNKYLDDLSEEDIRFDKSQKTLHLLSNILDISGISLKHISEELKVNLGRDNYVLCVSPFYPQMERIYNQFLLYFHSQLPWCIRDYCPYNENNRFTYAYLAFKLEANKQEQFIQYEYFPASQFRVCALLDCIRTFIDPDKHNEITYFNVSAPFELGASISEDINPLLAVLNNVISRGLPTRISPTIEKALGSAFQLTEEQNEYGSINYPATSILDEMAIKSALEGKLTSNTIVNQLVFTPIAIARVEKTLLEALVLGRLSLNQAEWNVLIEESDVPFARLAIADFTQLLENLIPLSKEYAAYSLPKIILTVVSSEQYATSPLNKGYEIISQVTTAIADVTYDLVIEYSSVAVDGNSEFSRFSVRNDCFFTICGAGEQRYAERCMYTTDSVIYDPLCYKAPQGNYVNIDKNVEHLRYFLQLIFRKQDFREGQIPILSQAMQGRSVIGLLPTGGGKSLTYQLAAFMQPGVSLVIDPLISLMKDQYDGLINNGIDCCTYINSTISSEIRTQRENAMEKSRCLFVFLSPERLCILRFRQRLRNMQELNVYFSYGIIDEVHCVSEWGHDFRFSYLHLGRNLYQNVLPKQPIDGEKHISLFGLTATASFDVLADVERELSGNGAFPLDGDAIVRYENTNRLELQYKVVEVNSENCFEKWAVYNQKNAMVASVLQEAKEYLDELQTPQNIAYMKKRFIDRENITDPTLIKNIQEADITTNVSNTWYVDNNTKSTAIVFCPHRAGCLGVNDSANQRGIAQAISADLHTNKVSNYVGGDALAEQDRFLYGDTNIMVATKAFGMGIDKPNVRFTLNVCHSGSLEGYVQEAGRAGRDRKIALSTILYSSKELSVQNPRTRILEVLPVDSAVHQFFYDNSFLGETFEKFIMWYLLSKNSQTTYSNEEEQHEDRHNTVSAVSGFIETLLAASPNTTLTYYIPYSYQDEDLKWLNNELVIRRLPKFKTKADEEAERKEKQKYGKARGYLYGYADYAVAIQKAIYRMCCVGIIDDFTQDYNPRNKVFRIVTRRKPDGGYFDSLRMFLLRYYSEERVAEEIDRAKAFRGENEMQKCLGFITDFVYEKIATKRKRAIQDMEDFCYQATHSPGKSWLEINEDLKDHIYYYFNSKYARDNFETEKGLQFSLTQDTQRGAYSSFKDIVLKYMRVIDDDVMDASDSQIGNIKHLQGAVRLIRRSLTDSNPSLDLLNAFCIMFLGTNANANLEAELENSYIAAYSEFRLRSKNNIRQFYNDMKQFKMELTKEKRNVADPKMLKQLETWEQLSELSVHATWLTQFKSKYSK